VTIIGAESIFVGVQPMCQIFAGRISAYETRSVRLMGHTTSACGSAKFWVIIGEIAAVQQMSLARFLTQLYEEALDIGRLDNFASLLRCCLNYLARDFDRGRLP
jgi:predicted DNA-binding ribbon-helix-helix protein